MVASAPSLASSSSRCLFPSSSTALPSSTRTACGGTRWSTRSGSAPSTWQLRSAQLNEDLLIRFGISCCQKHENASSECQRRDDCFGWGGTTGRGGRSVGQQWGEWGVDPLAQWEPFGRCKFIISFFDANSETNPREPGALIVKYDRHLVWSPRRSSLPNMDCTYKPNDT